MQAQRQKPCEGHAFTLLTSPKNGHQPTRNARLPHKIHQPPKRLPVVLCRTFPQPWSAPAHARCTLPTPPRVERYTGGFQDIPAAPRYFWGRDPLVDNVPGRPDIGHDLYGPHSMPPFAMRRDPDDPRLPQPITMKLLTQVLWRNYYEVWAWCRARNHC